MRILLTGKNGQLGFELHRSLAPIGEVRALSSQELDLAKPDKICNFVRQCRPDIIVNAAAYTAVDQAETEVEQAQALNAVAPAVMAEEAKKIGAVLVHFSTDYVFDGLKSGMYSEQDTPCPLNVYGRTKLAGEIAISESDVSNLTFRTSWVYAARGKNFLRTVLRLAGEHTELKIVDDQIGAPNWSRWLAETTTVVLSRLSARGRSASEFPRGRSGLFHLSVAGETSWFGFAQEILERVSPRKDKHWANLVAIPTEDYPLPAQRPANSRLSTSRLQREFGVWIPDWRECLSLCLQELG